MRKYGRDKVAMTVCVSGGWTVGGGVVQEEGSLLVSIGLRV
jgi:hypothetical protein